MSVVALQCFDGAGEAVRKRKITKTYQIQGLESFCVDERPKRVAAIRLRE